MKDITWLDMLKLKGSWGTLGNQNLDRAYPAEPLLTNAYSAVFGTPSAIYPGYQLAYLPNPKLRWEKVEAWEAGAEANFLRNRPNSRWSQGFRYPVRCPRCPALRPAGLWFSSCSTPLQSAGAVSYTHLDVYKRQMKMFPPS